MPYAAASDLSNQRPESLLPKLSATQLRSKYSKVSTTKPLKRQYSIEHLSILCMNEFIHKCCPTTLCHIFLLLNSADIWTT